MLENFCVGFQVNFSNALGIFLMYVRFTLQRLMVGLRFCCATKQVTTGFIVLEHVLVSVGEGEGFEAPLGWASGQICSPGPTSQVAQRLGVI